MAGERKGISYEALLKVALDRLLTIGALPGAIHWNVTASGMTVTPDFTIGDNADKPKVVLLVTHSKSAKNSDMKSWRNLGELAECKLRLKSVPNVYNIAFDSIVKNSLKLVGAAAFDGQLVVGDRPYGGDLIEWIDNNHKSLPKSGEDKADAIRKLIDAKDSELIHLFRKLVSDLKKLLLTSNPELESLWRAERRRKAGACPTAKSTSVRRGMSKLLIFEDIDLAVRLYTRKKVQISEVPQYAFDLGLARKSLVGAAGSDPEIAGAFKLLSVNDIKRVIENFDRNKVEAWVLSLRNASHFQFGIDYIDSNFKALCEPAKLLRNLQDLHRDPFALVHRKKVPENWPPQSVWLFDLLLEILKGVSHNANGYGIAQLGADVVRRGFGSVSDLKGVQGFGGGFGISGWARRDSRAKFSSELLNGVSCVIAEQLQEIGKKEIAKVASDQFEQATSTLINAKLCSYNGFDPLASLVAAHVPGLVRVRVRAAYAEAAGLIGSAAVMTLGKAKSTLIKWQSATDNGKDHKVKELCGRAAALRYSWDQRKEIFVSRKGVKKLILVIDGTWRQHDLESLSSAGWDTILYPDELDQLEMEIV